MHPTRRHQRALTVARHSSYNHCSMIYLLISHLVSLLLGLFAISRRSERHKDLQILLLRHQLRILQRQHLHKPNVSRLDKLTLAVLAAKLAGAARGDKAMLEWVLLLFKPDTVLRWHRDLVRRKWTFKKRRLGAHRATDPDLTALLLRLASENATWGYSRLHGELLKLSYRIGRSTVRDILKRRHVPPAPDRGKQGSSWRSFLGHYANQFLACDFLTVETVWLKTIYVFFFMELGTRRVHFAGCTAHPTGEWVTQQARPHQGIEQRCPIPIAHGRKEGPVKCRQVLGGIIHDYHRLSSGGGLTEGESVDDLSAHYRPPYHAHARVPYAGYRVRPVEAGSLR